MVCSVFLVRPFIFSRGLQETGRLFSLKPELLGSKETSPEVALFFLRFFGGSRFDVFHDPGKQTYIYIYIYILAGVLIPAKKRPPKLARLGDSEVRAQQETSNAVDADFEIVAEIPLLEKTALGVHDFGEDAGAANVARVPSVSTSRVLGAVFS